VQTITSGKKYIVAARDVLCKSRIGCYALTGAFGTFDEPSDRDDLAQVGVSGHVGRIGCNLLLRNLLSNNDKCTTTRLLSFVLV